MFIWFLSIICVEGGVLDIDNKIETHVKSLLKDYTTTHNTPWNIWTNFTRKSTNCIEILLSISTKNLSI